MFIDAHSHIHVKNFDFDREQVIVRLKAAGVSKIIEVGFSCSGIFKALALAKKHDWIYAAIGIHPHLASEWSDDVSAKILKMAKTEDKIVAIGETGLDYFKNFQSKNLQQKVFREQLKIASEVSLPVIIHCRDAYKDLFRILDEEKFAGRPNRSNDASASCRLHRRLPLLMPRQSGSPYRVLLHCFTGTMKEAEEGIRHGYFIAFTGVITYPNAKSLREIAEKIPLDRILIETDCPFLAPQSQRGKRNEPSFVPEIYQEIAKIKGMPVEKLAEQINKNASVFFGI